MGFCGYGEKVRYFLFEYKEGLGHWRVLSSELMCSN